MATFSRWLDDYDGPDNIVAGVAKIWADAVGVRPRASAAGTISEWLRANRGVHDDAMRAAVRAYNESRTGRQVTPEDAAAFRAMNEPGTIAPVPDQPASHQQPDQAAAGPPPPMEQASLPAVMAALGRIEQRLGELTQAQMIMLSWADKQDERLAPITRLLQELGEAEDQADAEEALEGGDGQPVPGPGTGGLWRDIAAPEPDFAAMAEAGDPAAAEDHGG